MKDVKAASAEKIGVAVIAPMFLSGSLRGFLRGRDGLMDNDRDYDSD